MAKTKVLCHDDEVSGMTVFPDGMTAYWTEGRSSVVYFELPDGQIVESMAGDPNCPHQARLIAVDDDPDVECGAMDEAQTAKFETVRGW